MLMIMIRCDLDDNEKDRKSDATRQKLQEKRTITAN